VAETIEPAEAPPPLGDSSDLPAPVELGNAALQALQALEDEEPESVGVRARDSMMPEPATKQKESPRMITLTMLDGTEVRLPAAGKRSQNTNASGELTARDLVEALRAEGGGEDLSEVFGSEVNWQKMFAALLSLMLKKHLILDWEFVRELKR
jgi:type IV pilus assembly protein PilB